MNFLSFDFRLICIVLTLIPAALLGVDSGIQDRGNLMAFARSSEAKGFLDERIRQIETKQLEPNDSNVAISYNYLTTTPLHVALFHGQDILKKVLSYGANTNGQDNTGQTPLHLAVRLNDIKIVEALLEHEPAPPKPGEFSKRSVDLGDSSGSTALMLAIHLGYDALAERIMKEAPSQYMFDANGKSALHFAVLKRNLKLAKLLLENKAPINRADTTKTTPVNIIFIPQPGDNGQLIADFINLFFVDFNGDIDQEHPVLASPRKSIAASSYAEVQEINARLNLNGPRARKIDFFLKKDTDSLFYEIENPTFRGWELSLKEIKRLLAEENPNINARNIYDVTPLVASLNTKYTEAALELLSCPGIEFDGADGEGLITPLSQAASSAPMALVVKKLLELGAQVNARDKHQRTALMRAASGEIASLLLEKCALVNAQDSRGNTALHYALQHYSVDVSWVQTLLNAGARVDIKNKEEKTPLDIFDAIDAQKLFSQSGRAISEALIGAASVSAPDQNLDFEIDDDELLATDSRFPLHQACKKNDLTEIRRLLKEGANKYATDSEGKTAFQIAAEHNHFDIAKLFLDSGLASSFLNMKDKAGYSAFHYAVASGNLDMAKAIADAGADIHGETTHRGNALHLALEAGHEKMADYLLRRFVNIFATNSQGHKPIDIAADDPELLDIMGKINTQDKKIKQLFNAALNDDHEYINNFCKDYLSTQEGMLILPDILRAIRNEEKKSLVEVATGANKIDALFALVLNGAEFFEDIRDKRLEVLLYEKFNAHSKELKYSQLKAHAALIMKYNNSDLEAFTAYVTDPANKADLNSRFAFKDGNALIHLAIRDKRKDFAKTLVELGADIYIKDSSGKTIINYIFNDPEWNDFFINVLYPRQQELKSLFTEIEQDYFTAKELQNLQKKLSSNNSNARNSEGKTLLMIAAQNGNVPLMEMLINNGADRFATDYHNVSVSDWVLDSENPRAIALTPYMSVHKILGSLLGTQCSMAELLLKLREESRRRQKTDHVVFTFSP